jgi:NAD-reducing hydrogenase small subunit
MSAKKTVATASLAGCFGCHMSILDIDERLFPLLELVEFDRSPIDDLKSFSRPVDIGLIEGGCCNSDNVAVLKDFRKNCKTLIAVGECAIMGGLPSMRNGIPIRECFEEAYLRSPSVKHNEQGTIPNDRELPILLDKVYPCQEIVKIDYSLPGCPPRADLIWEVLTALLQNREPQIPYEDFKYD